MDAYHDDGMGNIIIGRPFCRKACVKARQFDEMITIYKGNDSVTYQMARSHSRLKHLTNAQCNKMRPLLKVSAQDELKGLNTVIEDVMRQLSFKETELDGEAGFGDVAESGVESSRLIHYDSFRLPVPEEPDVSRTQEPIVEDVIVEDYVSSKEDVEQGYGQEDKSDPSDGHFFYDDEWVDSAYDTQYDVHSSEDASDPGDDNETSNYRRRRLAELSRETKGVINASGQWKYSFYTGQKFTTAKEAKDKVYLHFIERRRNLKLYKNDSVKCLGDDIDLDPNLNFTFISDRQKGIIPTIKTVFPSAEHSYCLRHIYENMKQGWCGQAYKDLLWRYASAISVKEFQKCRAKSDLLLNNICEVFNSKIVGGRDKPVITLLEFIKEYYMKRIVNVQSVIDKYTGPLTPTTTRITESIKKEAHLMKVKWNGGNKYQISGLFGDQCIVDVVTKTCSCRKWELTGIPCKYVVTACWNMALNDRATPPPKSVGKSLLLVDYV
ncbi:mutator type transposase [Tanacetum coccineum]